MRSIKCQIYMEFVRVVWAGLLNLGEQMVFKEMVPFTGRIEGPSPCLIALLQWKDEPVEDFCPAEDNFKFLGSLL